MWSRMGQECKVTKQENREVKANRIGLEDSGVKSETGISLHDLLNPHDCDAEINSV